MAYFDLIVDLHKNNQRQGPGSDDDSLKALSYMDLPEHRLKVTDIGSGTGAQSLAIAKELNADIVCVDLFPEFLNLLNERAQTMGLVEKISTLEASMDELPFQKESLDIIWSEGAIYNIGFKKGIQYWKQFLKPEGYLALSEISWISSERPKEIEDFWMSEYPEIDSIENKKKVLETEGFDVKAAFALEPSSWIEHYYKPLEEAIPGFLERHHHSDEAKAIAEENIAEIALYEKYQNYYSYGFYVAQKRD